MRPHRNARQNQAERELTMALEEAARTADKHESNQSIARRVYRDQPQLMQVLAKQWAIDHMVRILSKLSRAAAEEDQLKLPGINLPAVVRLLKPDPESKRPQKPERLPLLDLNLPQLLEYRKQVVRTLQPAHNRKVQEIDKAIALMRKYAPRSRKATLREVFEKHGQEILFEYKTLGAG